MSKYEIMVVLDGTLNESNAKKIFIDVKNYLTNVKKNEITEMGHKQLAYQINKISSGYYYFMQFDCDEPAVIAEFRRLTLLNKSVIRHLIINLEKDYGYKASQNPKKVAKSLYRSKIYSKVSAKIDEEREKFAKLRDDTPIKVTDI